MKCKNCNTNLSFIPHPVTVSTKYGKFETQQVKLAVCTSQYLQLTVICYKCKATHDIKYGFEKLVQAYTEDEFELFIDKSDPGPNDEMSCEVAGEEIHWGDLSPRQEDELKEG